MTRVQKLFDDPNVKYLLEQAQKLKAETAAASPAPGPNSPSTPKAKTKLFSEVVPLYIAEKALDNTPKTLEEKRATYTEFQRLFTDGDVGGFESEHAITFKNRMISDGLNSQRINKKLSFMKDFFGYAWHLSKSNSTPPQAPAG